MLWVAERHLACWSDLFQELFIILEYLPVQALFPIFYSRSSCICVISLFYFQLKHSIFWENHYSCNPSEPVVSFGLYEDWKTFLPCLLWTLSHVMVTSILNLTRKAIRCHISKVVQKRNVFLKCIFYLESAFICKAVVLTVGSGCLRPVIFGVIMTIVPDGSGDSIQCELHQYKQYFRCFQRLFVLCKSSLY